jgi:hypothetical protein
VTEQVQAQYTVEAIVYARSHWNWAGVFNIWYFRQAGDIFREDREDYYFRMVDPRFTPRPLYNAVKEATSSAYVASPGTFAVTDPSATNSGSWSPILAAAAIGGVMLSSSNPGDSITITFRGGRFNLFVQRAPNAGQLYLTVDGREANLIRDTAQERSVLSLTGSSQEAPILVPVADGLGPGTHVVRLVVGSASAPIHGSIAIAGFEVQPVDRFAAILRTAGVVGGAVLLSVVILLVLRARGRRQTSAPKAQ